MPSSPDFHGRLSRLLLASAFALGACTADAPTRKPDAADRVLLIAYRSTPTSEDVRSALRQGGRGLPVIEVDVLQEAEPASVRAALQALRDQGKRYRAVFSISPTFARAAQVVMPDVPVIFEGVTDPVRLCLVDSLQRPGRNATGYMHLLGADETKKIELLHDAYPDLKEVLFLMSGLNLPPPNCDLDDPYWTAPFKPDCQPGERELDYYITRRVRGAEIQAYAQARGLKLRFVVTCDVKDYPALVRWAEQRPHSGWVVPWHDQFNRNRRALVDQLNASGLPAIYPRQAFVQEGGLMSLSALEDTGSDRPALLSLLQVLGGRDPAGLPVQSPRGFTVTVNGRTAERLAPRPSLFVLRRADQVLR